jgi:hypothetical protein
MTASGKIFFGIAKNILYIATCWQSHAGTRRVIMPVIIRLPRHVLSGVSSEWGLVVGNSLPCLCQRAPAAADPRPVSL